MKKFNTFLNKILNKLTSKNKRKLIFSFVWLFFSILIIPHISYFIFYASDTFNKSKNKLSFMNEIKIEEVIKFKNYGTFFDLNDQIEKILLIGIFAVFIIILFDVIMNLLLPNHQYEEADDYGSHGSSRWLNNNEIKESFYNNKKGWWVGSLEEKSFNLDSDGIYLPFENEVGLNSQVIVFGSPNSRKSTSLVIPNILNLCFQYANDDIRPDIIVTDPKSELWKQSNDYLQKSGYEVFVLDFITLESGHSLNPMDFIDDDISLREICKNFIVSMGGEPHGDAQTWQNFEYLVLAALVGFVTQNDKCKKNFCEVYDILTSKYVKEHAETFFSDHKITGTPLKLWNAFLLGAESTRTISSILIGVAEKLSIFDDKVQKITNQTTLPIKQFGIKKEKPFALFILTPDSNNTYQPIINMVISTLLKQLYKTSYECNGSLQTPVHLILDEMANVGKIPRIEEMLGTMRGRKIYPMMILQSLSQLKERYPKSYEDILSQCDTSILLGVNDIFTAEYFSKLIGKTTIKIKSTSKKAETGILDNSNERDSDQYQSRELLQPSEITRFDNNYLIMIRRSTFPSKIRKVQYKFWETPIAEESNIKNFIKLPDLIDNVSFLKLKKTSEEKEISNVFEMKKQATIIHKLTRTALKYDNKELIEKFENEIKNKKELFTVTKDYDGKFLDIDDNLIDDLYQAYVKNNNEEINETLNNIDKYLEKIQETQNNLDNLEFNL